MENNTQPDPIEPEKITNSDESRELPGPDSINIEPPQETDLLDKEYEGTREAGNVASTEENITDDLDGSNANNLRTK